MNGKEILQEMDARFMAVAEQRDQLRTENAKLKAQLEQSQGDREHFKKCTLELGEQFAKSKVQLDQFHAAMEKEKDPKWSEELKELAARLLERDPLDTERAADQLRYMADCFTLKANFVPMELEIKELNAQLEQVQAACAEMGGFITRTFDWDCIICDRDRDERDHAISADCGKGYVSVSELTTTIELLEVFIRETHDAGNVPIGLSQPLANLKALQEKAK